MDRFFPHSHIDQVFPRPQHVTAPSVLVNSDIELVGKVELSNAPTTDMEAATKRYVDEAIATQALYQGTWRPDTNVPNLADPAVQQDGWTWVAVTPDPTIPVTVTATIPGLTGLVIDNGDRITWANTPAIFQVVKGAGITLGQADARYLQLTGGTLTGPLTATDEVTINADLHTGTVFGVGGTVQVQDPATFASPTTFQGNAQFDANLRPFVFNREMAAPNPFSYQLLGSTANGFKLRSPRLLSQSGMFYFTIRLFSNYNTVDIAVSGYLFGGAAPGNPWFWQPRAQIISGNTHCRVIMGLESDGRMYVFVGPPGAGNPFLSGTSSWAGLGVWNLTVPNGPVDWNTGWSMQRTSNEADMPNRYFDRLLYPPSSGDWYNYQSELVAAPGITFYTQTRSCAFESNGRQVICTQLLNFGGANNLIGEPPAAFNWGANGSHVYPVSGIRGAFRPNNSIYFPCTIMPFGAPPTPSANLLPGYSAYCSVDNQGRISVAFGERPGWPNGGYIFMHFTYNPSLPPAWDIIPEPTRIIAPNPLQ